MKTLTRSLLSIALAAGLALLAIPTIAHAADADTIAKMEGQVEKMRGQRAAADAQLKAAQEARNFRCIEAIQEGITAQDGLLKLAEQNLAAGKEAASSGDSKTVENTATTLNVAAQKMNEISAQMSSCMSGAGDQPAGTPGATGDGTGTGDAPAGGDEGVEVLGEADSPLGPSYAEDGSPVGSGVGSGANENGFGDGTTPSGTGDGEVPDVLSGQDGDVSTTPGAPPSSPPNDPANVGTLDTPQRSPA